ncbi:MAG: thioredoxin fold domain-containing protein [Bacteroidota bacterium]
MIASLAAAPTTWVTLPVALQAAAVEERPVLLYVRAPWCGPCALLERDVFPAVEPLLNQVERARLTFDDHDTLHRVGDVTQSEAAWAAHYGATATPTLVLLQPDGQVITRLTGTPDAEGLGLLLAYVTTGAYRHVSFEAYAAQVNPSNIP